MTFLTKSRAAALLFALWAGAAHAGILEDDEARKAILDLRAKVDALARDMQARMDAKLDTKLDKTASLDMMNQQEQTMAEIAKLRGQIEVLANQLATIEKHEKDLYADLDARLKKVEPHEVTVDGKTTEVDPLEQKSYEAAMATLKAGDFAAARGQLSDFVKRYPGSTYASNAQYWLGNSMYASGDFKGAIPALLAVVSNYPDSPKAPDALLNVASSYLELKDKKNARKYLQMAVAKYPGSSAAATAKERLKTLK
ncbi:MAG: tol-pal system protein YbgF [Telluria sp.]